MRFTAAERIADAILYEGYVLYPYRASAAKNQFRWQFGVVAPRAPRDDGEPWFAQTECLVDPGESNARLSIRVRCLCPRPATAAGTSGSWLEGVPHTVHVDAIPLDVLPSERAAPLHGVHVSGR